MASQTAVRVVFEQYYGSSSPDLAGSLQAVVYTWGAHSLGVSGVLSRSFAINTWEEGTCVPDYSMLMAALSPYWSMRLMAGGYRGDRGTAPTAPRTSASRREAA